VDNLIVDSTKGLYYFALVSQPSPLRNLAAILNRSQVSQIPWIDLFLDKNPLVRIGPRQTSQKKETLRNLERLSTTWISISSSKINTQRWLMTINL
jgi:hypothetical protein